MRKIKILGSVAVILVLLMLVTPLTATVLIHTPKYGPTCISDLPGFDSFTYAEYQRLTEKELNEISKEYGQKCIYGEVVEFYNHDPRDRVPKAVITVTIFVFTNEYAAQKAYELLYEDIRSNGGYPVAIDIGDEGVCYYGVGGFLFREDEFICYGGGGEEIARRTEQSIKIATAPPTPKPTPIPIPVATPTPIFPPVTSIPPTVTPAPTSPPVLPISPEYLYVIPIALFLILFPFIFHIRGKRKKPATTTPEKPQPPAEPPKPETEPVKEKPIIKKETPLPISNSITIERAIYDPCKRDFVERALPRMKEWINRYDPGAYWFAVSIQNNTDRAIEECGIELETSSALKVEEVKIEGIDYKIELRETYPEPYKNVLTPSSTHQ